MLRDAQAVGVAIGAGVFMLSDTLIAINRFAQPLPMAAFWVLASYYVAQVLIVRNVRPAGAGSWGLLRSPPAYGDHGHAGQPS